MKEINELNLPADVFYSNDHEWARAEGDKVRIGISDYAQDRLGDITFVEVPEVGDVFGAGEELGTVESTKAVSEVLMPIDGEVLAVNEALEESPDLINKDPYIDGWIIEIKPDGKADLETLMMTKENYLKMLEGMD
jgi:glycine cleavage system H protein